MRSAVALFIAMLAGASASASETQPLTLEATIPLGRVTGRIDHLAIDLPRQRLFVAELGNDSVGVVDLKSGKLLRTMTGLSEPQGLVFVAATDQLYVANAGDGSVRAFNGSDLSPAGLIELGADADNLRVDPMGRYVLAGYGSGAIALLDLVQHKKIAEIPLRAHPEGFQVSRDGHWAYVNVPDNHEIAVVDLTTRKQIATWPTRGLGANFPMSLDESGGGLWVAFRSPPRLTWYDIASSTATVTVETCGDSDDVFTDSRRHRVYIVCGSGHVEVFQRQAVTYTRVSRVGTREGARTGLYVPELDRLFVAARATRTEPATILVYRPSAP
ncbi:MAG: hypothetical protein ABI859_16260 [Pseudomonadota bacterium]